MLEPKHRLANDYASSRRLVGEKAVLNSQMFASNVYSRSLLPPSQHLRTTPSG